MKIEHLNLNDSTVVEKLYFYEKAFELKEISIYCFLKIGYWSLLIYWCAFAYFFKDPHIYHVSVLNIIILCWADLMAMLIIDQLISLRTAYMLLTDH